MSGTRGMRCCIYVCVCVYIYIYIYIYTGDFSEKDDHHEWDERNELLLEELKSEMDGMKSRVGSLETELARSVCVYVCVCVWFCVYMYIIYVYYIYIHTFILAEVGDGWHEE